LLSFLILIQSASNAQTISDDSLIKYGNSLVNAKRDSSLQIANSVIQRQKNNLLQANAFKLKSLVFYFDGKFDSAASYLLKALAISEKFNDSNSIGRIYNELGTLWKKQDNVEKALQFYKQAERTFKATGDSVELANTYNNMGMVSEVNGKLNEAYEFYNAALAIQYSKQITVALGYTYANIEWSAYCVKTVR
jgi:tetratricopeptide (TPR) repeat protein